MRVFRQGLFIFLALTLLGVGLFTFSTSPSSSSSYSYPSPSTPIIPQASASITPSCFTADLEATLPGIDVPGCLSKLPLVPVPQSRDEADPKPSPTGARNAYVFHVVLQPYAFGTWVTIKALMAYNTTADFVVICTGDQKQLPAEMLAALQAFGPRVRFWPVDAVTGSNLAAFSDSFTKLRAWQLMEYDSVMFLDSDVMPGRNLDDLFVNAAEHPFSAPVDNFVLMLSPMLPRLFFNSGLFVARPSLEMYAELRSEVVIRGKTATGFFADMDFLNDFFQEYHELDPKEHLLLSIFCARYFPLAHLFRVGFGSIHYNNEKPFRQRHSPISQYMFDWWYSVAESKIEVLAAKRYLGLQAHC